MTVVVNVPEAIASLHTISLKWWFQFKIHPVAFVCFFLVLLLLLLFFSYYYLIQFHHTISLFNSLCVNIHAKTEIASEMLSIGFWVYAVVLKIKSKGKNAHNSCILILLVVVAVVAADRLPKTVIYLPNQK